MEQAGVSCLRRLRLRGREQDEERKGLVAGRGDAVWSGTMHLSLAPPQEGPGAAASDGDGGPPETVELVVGSRARPVAARQLRKPLILCT